MAFFSFPAEVNERAARIVAGVVASSIALSIALDARPVVVILAIGFWLRTAFGPRISPLARLAVMLAPRLGPAVLVPGPPKRFAQTLGAIFTTTSAILLYTGSPIIGWSLAGMVALLASFESALAACLGCWIYGVCAVRLSAPRA